ncbi:hypothetical protein LB507_011365 [Fusarium sp. FIESC RH6]|nr:hypothetical protein LB507_011365 [Fusarium sp. FIESC RH6]
MLITQVDQLKQLDLAANINLCFYFVHPDFNLEKLNLGCFWKDVRECLHEAFPFEIFSIPRGSNADCVQHYREELEARGDVFEQVREVDKAKRDPEYAAAREAQGKLTGLVSSHKYPGAMAYHGLVIDRTFEVVQFGPALTSEDFEPGDRKIVQEPLMTTRVRATSKEDSQRFEDQGVWSWFMNHKPSNWWYDVLYATTDARDLGWSSW